MNWLLVFIGGGIGCMLRYLIGLAFQQGAFSLPWSTFMANIVACLVFAIVAWLAATRDLIPLPLRLFLITGFCGGLSTFSSFGFETFMLLKQGLLVYALLNILFNTCFCILIFYIFKFP